MVLAFFSKKTNAPSLGKIGGNLGRRVATDHAVCLDSASGQVGVLALCGCFRLFLWHIRDRRAARVSSRLPCSPAQKLPSARPPRHRLPSVNRWRHSIISCWWMRGPGTRCVSSSSASSRGISRRSGCERRSMRRRDGIHGFAVAWPGAEAGRIGSCRTFSRHSSGIRRPRPWILGGPSISSARAACESSPARSAHGCTASGWWCITPSATASPRVNSWVTSGPATRGSSHGASRGQRRVATKARSRRRVNRPPRSIPWARRLHSRGFFRQRWHALGQPRPSREVPRSSRRMRRSNSTRH